jgi:serine/threonine protein kinase
MADRVGQQLGNYRLIRWLGQGGFAEVYLGEHIHLGTQAAIKVMHTQLAHADVEQFRTEARTIARLVHPHIVRVLEFDVAGTTPFLVMDYAPNGTLRQRYPTGSMLPLSTVISYVKQITDALQYAHDEKFIHRDIKPENMLLGRRGEMETVPVMARVRNWLLSIAWFLHLRYASDCQWCTYTQGLQ